MNWTRYLRALSATHIMTVEERRRDLIAGRIQTLSADEMVTIDENNELLSKYGQSH